jgi:DNA-binding response OmpR family regulator
MSMPNSKQATVFVIEDDRIVAAMVKHLLARQGYNVISASDGREALEMIAGGESPELVLLDVMLPFIDGFELIAQIRSTPAWASVPIVMLTSKTQERNIVRALDAGADDYIVKPFQPQALIARVRRLARPAAVDV